MSKPIYILGTALSHDGSSCLMRNGQIVVAVEKERLSKKKHDGFNDNLTIEYCLNAAGIGFNDLDLIVQEDTTNLKLKPYELEKRGNRNIPDYIPKVTISHHLAHAYSAIGTSSFKDMAIMVIDGQGSSIDTCIDFNKCLNLPTEFQNLGNDSYKYWEFISFYSYTNNSFKTIFKDFSLFHLWDQDEIPIAPADMLNSIGEFYDGVSNYIFDGSFCEGKTMGLAPYGRENIFYFDAFDFYDGRVKLRHDWMKNFAKYKSGKYIGFSENFQYFSDIAYWAQKQLEKAVIYCFNKLYDMVPCKNVAYAGGVALNAVLNSKLPTYTKFKNFYIQPAAGDNGLSIGCCYYGWLEYLKKERVMHRGSTYFGKIYSNSEVLSIINSFSEKIIYEICDDYIVRAAEILASGKIVGWFQEGAEFGPRTLGHRSILADPRRKDIRNFINRKIKTREDFRPFAPSIIKEELTNYFECSFIESSYMLNIGKVKPKYLDLIPGVTHKDGSARIQTVDLETSSKYYKLLKQFKAITGLPILLNTSFNGVNMPIVETPKDALDFFIKIQNIDLLVINNILVTLKK